MSLLEIFWQWLTDPEQWQGPDGIPARLIEHVWYSVLALTIAAVIALPLGMLIGHTGRGAFLAVNSANAARALPTLGLLMLVVLAAGVGLLPVLVALIALAIPSILLNTFEGIRSVDADVVDAAQGVGMTGGQVLRKVELPLAAPLIVLGLRTAAIQIVSTATIAAYVSLGGLGRFIVDGLARRDYELVVGGAVLVAVLAVLTQAGFALIYRTLQPARLAGAALRD